MSGAQKCHVIEVIKSFGDAEFLQWLSELDRAGFFQKSAKDIGGRIFSAWEAELAADFFLKTRCCRDLGLIRHTDGHFYCLFHLPTAGKDKERFSEALKARIVEIDRAIVRLDDLGSVDRALFEVRYAYDFRHVWFPSEPLDFAGRFFPTPVDFRSARFGAGSSFRDCRFAGTVNFSNAEFADGAEFAKCRFEQKAVFRNLKSLRRLAFDNNKFNDFADFSGMQVQPTAKAYSGEWDLILKVQIFRQAVSFSGTVFPPRTTFEYSDFRGAVDFQDIETQGINMKGADFRGRLSFVGAVFNLPLDPSGGSFSDELDFSDAHFRGYQSFTGFRFPKKVTFARTRFTLAATFIHCEFAADADFDGAIFESTAIFSDSVFRRTVSFRSTEFRWHAAFREAEFSGRAIFGATFEKYADFTRAVFTGEVAFGLRHYENIFNDRTIFTSVRFLSVADFTYSAFNFSVNKFEEVDFSRTAGLPENLQVPQKIKMRADLIIHNAGQLVTCRSNNTVKKGGAMRDLGIIENGAIAVNGQLIMAIGKSDEILADYESELVIDAASQVVMPGFVDPHTHIIYAGNRLNEFELKIKGADYLEILANGGGILSTVRETRAATDADLIAQTRKRLDKMLRHGTTTAEIKTGYGLDAAAEFKMLDVWEELDRRHPIYLVPTFLAAHAVPPEFKNDPGGYVDLICEEMLPALVRWRTYGYIDPDRIDFAEKAAKPFFVDVFCERNAFNIEETRRILETARRNGFALKAHVDEFTNLGGSQLCIELGAVSIDHLDAISDPEIELLAASATVGIVTPTVNFNFGSAHFADARKLIDAGCAIAVSTDYNPGSAPCPSQQTTMQIACRYQKLLPAEAITAATVNAAWAIGLGDKTGSLEVGKWADFVILETDDYREVCYEFGGNFVKTVIKAGRQV